MKSYRLLARSWLSASYAFLYLPIVVLVVFSFNSARQSMAWSGFTLHWYSALLADAELGAAFGLSLRIAVLSASISVVLGMLAAFVLNHYRRFAGRALFSGMVSAPLVMPEVIIGLSLLLMLVSVERWFGFPQRGLSTVCIGHAVLGMAYATVVIQSRLREMNKSLSEAAMDLGCKPHQVFFLVTLPNLAQSLVSAWLLAFTLSLDNVVLSGFLTGPGYSTMPIVIFSRARLGLDPRVNAVATLTVLVVSTVVILATLYQARAARTRLQQTA